MNLLQRLRAPFTDASEDDAAEMRARQHVVGSALRERREEFELDLESVGEALRIKPTYLAAIEQGRPQDLPGPAYALGFVRAYAHYLGFDSDEVLEQYKAESADAQARPDLALPVPLGARSVPGGAILLVGAILAGCGYGTWYYLSTGERSRPERVAAVPVELQQTLRGAPPAAPSPPPPGAADPGNMRFGSGIVATPNTPLPPSTTPSAGSATSGSPVPAPGIVANPALAAQPGAGSANSQQAGKPATPAAGAAPTPPATAGASPEPKPALASVAPPTREPASPDKAVQAERPVQSEKSVESEKPGPTPAAAVVGDAGKGAGRVEIRALADCWIQVRAADGDQIVFSRVLKAGETYNVPRTGLFLRTGNAGALAIAVDGKPAPSIGGIGTLRRNVVLDPDPLLAGTAVKG